jgi:hypothetical protein
LPPIFLAVPLIRSSSIVDPLPQCRGVMTGEAYDVSGVLM